MIRNIKKRYWFAKQLCHHKWIFFLLLFTWINYRVQQSLTINCTFIIILTNFFFSVATKSIQSHMAKRKRKYITNADILAKIFKFVHISIFKNEKESIDFFLTTEAKCLYCSWYGCLFLPLSWNYHCIKSFLWTLSMCIMDYLSFQLNNSRYW